tara:strand:- start:5327 stop:6790 length:1464 start_codon:yes stop_codon:yes gene_type:complete
MYTIRNDNKKDMNILENSIINKEQIFNNIKPDEEDNNTHYNIAYVKNILKNNYLKNFYKNIEYTKQIHLHSKNRVENSTLFNPKFDISTIGIKNIVKCDLIKAVIPKTRQLINKTTDFNGNYNIRYCYSNNTTTSINSGATDNLITINNSNYSVTELQDIITTHTNNHFTNSIIDLDSTTSITNKNSDSVLGHTIGGKGTVLGHGSSEVSGQTKVIISMSNRIAYILGYTKLVSDNPYETIYSFNNYSTDNYKIKLIYEDNNNIESGQFNANTGFKNIKDFLNILNTDSFELIYCNNKYKIVNNRNNTLIKIEILKNGTAINGTNVLSDIIGITTNNVSLQLFESYNSDIKYILEFNDNTPNDGSQLTGNYYGFLISKYSVQFIDTHYIHFGIEELGSLQPIILQTKTKNIQILQSIDMNENYQNIIYYRSNNIDLELDRFTPIGILSSLKISLYDDNGYLYNCDSDWCVTIRFTMISQKEYDESYL